MKTPEEWIQHYQVNPITNPSIEADLKFIEDIQRDALSDSMAQTTLEQDRRINEGIEESKDLKIQRLERNIEVYRERWHECRRYLRAANKGAERNNMVMRLQAQTISKYLSETKL